MERRLGSKPGGLRGIERGSHCAALAFGALGLWVGLTAELPDWAFWIMPAVAVAIVVNIANRVRRGIASIQSPSE